MDECENLVIDQEEEYDKAETMGQTESKKKSKNPNWPETKGTAMSFGFRKKTHTLPKKKKSQKEKETDDLNDNEFNDTNGNTELTSKADTTWAIKTFENNPEHLPIEDNLNLRKNDTDAQNYVGQAIPHKNRFGFRSTNVVRPASTGLSNNSSRDMLENVENNNLNNTNKRRSKSATGPRIINRLNNDHAQHTNQVRFNDTPNIKTFIADSNEYSNNQWKHCQPKQKLSDVNRMQFFSQQYYDNQPTIQKNFPKNTYGAIRQQNNIINNSRMTSNAYLSSAGKFTLSTGSLPKPQYPVATTVQCATDIKSAKQIANNNRKGFIGNRETSEDSGISNGENSILDNSMMQSKDLASGNLNLDSSVRQRPRNLEMIMSSRHKFEVRDLNSITCNENIEPLALPKLPSIFSSQNPTAPLSGLVRSNTTLVKTSVQPLKQEDYKPNLSINLIKHSDKNIGIGRTSVEKTAKNQINSSKNSSPSSSRASWSNAGESLAVKDCSSISLSSDDSRNNENTFTIQTEDLSPIDKEEPPCLFASMTESTHPNTKLIPKVERPKFFDNNKFAEMAAAVSDILLDDETSPTDSLVSNSGSGDVICKKQKEKNQNILEKDIDEISPELEASRCSSPGTPTQASNSFSLSDIGKDFLIDDEIADQPGLLFNEKKNDKADTMQMAMSLTDTPPTLMDDSLRKSSPKNLSRAKNLMQAAIELSLRTPISLRKATMLGRAESLDTLSPCESLTSDDLMMDFEAASSMDSIDKIPQARSGNSSSIQIIDETELFSELENKGEDMIREWNNILKVHRNEKDNIISHLPARATRLLYRSRLQQQQIQLNNNGSESPKSIDSTSKKPPSSRASSLHCNSSRDVNSSSDDILLHDKSFRNSMIQDVLYFKKQLLRLRRILQETDTINPFELNGGQYFVSACGNYDTVDRHRQQNLDRGDKSLGSLQSLTSIDDPIQELTDLRRQVVYLQGQVDDRERTIKLQKNLIEKLEAENEKCQTTSVSTSISEKETTNTATQTDRVRPVSTGPDLLPNNKSEPKLYTVNLPVCNKITATTTISPIKNSLNHYQTSRRHTVISTTYTNLNRITPQTIQEQQNHRRASIPWEKIQYKPVKTTFIGEIHKTILLSNNLINNNTKQSDNKILNENNIININPNTTNISNLEKLKINPKDIKLNNNNITNIV